MSQDTVSDIIKTNERPIKVDETPQMTPVTGKGVARSWKPARLLDIPAHLKKPGFVYRWVSKNTPGRVEKLLAEGWEIDQELAKKLTLTKTIKDGSPLDGTVQMRELLVMRIPKELADQRNAYYAQKASGTVSTAEEALGSTKNHFYGKVESNG